MRLRGFTSRSTSGGGPIDTLVARLGTEPPLDLATAAPSSQTAAPHDREACRTHLRRLDSPEYCLRIRQSTVLYLFSTWCSHSRVTLRPSTIESTLLQNEPFRGRFRSTDLHIAGRALATVMGPGAHPASVEFDSLASTTTRSSLSLTILCQNCARVSSGFALRKTTNSVLSTESLQCRHDTQCVPSAYQKAENNPVLQHVGTSRCCRGQRLSAPPLSRTS